MSQPGQAGERHIVVAITGASGTVFGIRVLEVLRQVDVHTHLIISKAGQLALSYETDLSLRQLKDLATEVHPFNDVGANIASGSFQTLGMIIAPCTIKTMSEIATGVTSNLVSRAADVALKERRRLLLMLRETPLHLGHVRSMAQVTEMGGIIYPPVPAFYIRPKSIQDLIDYTVGRALDMLGIETGLIDRWQGSSEIEAS